MTNAKRVESVRRPADSLPMIYTIKFYTINSPFLYFLLQSWSSVRLSVVYR